MANPLKSLRFAILSNGQPLKPGEVAEALRDLFFAVKSMTIVRPVRLESFVWAPPFYVENDTRPSAVILGEARLAKQPNAPSITGIVDFTYLAGNIRIDSIAGLTVGTSYDISLVVVG